LADLRERVAADVRRAHRAILRAEKSIDIQTQAVEVSETQLELAQLRYERGLADNFDVVDAESNLFNAQSALVSARVDRAIAGLALELSMGRLSPGKYSR
jgi:outer membrane protein TolC